MFQLFAVLASWFRLSCCVFPCSKNSKTYVSLKVSPCVLLHFDVHSNRCSIRRPFRSRLPIVRCRRCLFLHVHRCGSSADKLLRVDKHGTVNARAFKCMYNGTFKHLTYVSPTFITVFRYRAHAPALGAESRYSACRRNRRVIKPKARWSIKLRQRASGKQVRTLEVFSSYSLREFAQFLNAPIHSCV